MGEIGNLEDEAMKRKQRLANMKRKFQVLYLILFCYNQGCGAVWFLVRLRLRGAASEKKAPNLAPASTLNQIKKNLKGFQNYKI